MRVKLIKGLSYSNGRVFASKDKPIIEVDEAEGEKLFASGRFKVVEEPAEVISEHEEEIIEQEGSDDLEGDNTEYIVPPVDFDKMTVDALKAYAKENEIDISGLTRKDEIKQALLEAINSRVPEIFTE